MKGLRLLAVSAVATAFSSFAAEEPVCPDPMDLTKSTVIDIGEGAVTNYTGQFSGGASLSKKGLGQLVMSNGANAGSFSGSISIELGSVRMDTDGALGTGGITYNGNGSGKADNIHEVVFNAAGATVPNNIGVKSSVSAYAYPAIRVLKNTTFTGRIRGFQAKDGTNPKNISIQDNPDGSVQTVFAGKVCAYDDYNRFNDPTDDVKSTNPNGYYLQVHGEMTFTGQVCCKGLDMSCNGNSAVVGSVHMAGHDNDLDWIKLSRGNLYIESIDGLPGYVWWDSYASITDQEHGSVFLKAAEVRLAGFRSDKILGDGRGQTVMRASSYTASNPRVTITGNGLAGQTLTGSPRFLSSIDVVLDAPADFTQVLQNRTHDFSYGSLTVSNGTLRLAGAFRCGGLAKLEVSGGRLDASSSYSGVALFTDAYAKTTLPTFRLNGDGQIGGTCKSISVSKFIYNGTDMGYGVFTHAVCPNIDEGFTVRVDYPPSDTVTATWTGAGTDDSIQTAANWSWSGSPELPPLTGRELVATFAEGGSSAAVDAETEWRGIVFKLAPFVLAGDQTLLLFENGLKTVRSATTEGPRVFTVGARLELQSDKQVFDIAAGDTVELLGGFGGRFGAPFTVGLTGRGSMRIANNDQQPFNGTICVTNGLLEVDGPLGSAASAGGIEVRNWTNKLAEANWETGMLVLSNAHVYGSLLFSRNAGQNYSWKWERYFEIAPNTTNVVEGPVNVSDTINPRFGSGSVLRCKQGWRQSSGYLTVQIPDRIRDVNVIFDGPLVQLNTGKGVSVVNGLLYTFNSTGCDIRGYIGGSSEFTVDYAFDKCALYNLYGGSTIDLKNTRQRVDKLSTSSSSLGYVKGVFPACLEIGVGTSDPAKQFIRTVFQGEASLLMGGDQIALVTNVTSTTVGDVAVTNGVLEFAHNAAWQYGTNVTVSGTGRLKLNRDDTFDKRFAVLHLGGTGVIEMKSGTLQSFRGGTIEDAEGNVTQIPAGTYTGAPTEGVMAGRVTGGGAVKVRGSGCILVVR